MFNTNRSFVTSKEQAGRNNKKQEQNRKEGTTRSGNVFLFGISVGATNAAAGSG